MHHEIASSPEGLPESWIPDPDSIARSNVGWLMRHAGVADYPALHAWSIKNREAYWQAAIERLGIRLQRPWSRLLDLSKGVENPRWLVDARLNIVESCFTAPPDAIAIIHQSECGALRSITYRELADLVQKVASGLARRGFHPGDRIAMVTPMAAETVAIYLGIIQFGAVVVGVADSFRNREIALRLNLAGATAVFTQDIIRRDGKQLPLYSLLAENARLPAIVLPVDRLNTPALRPGDISWDQFLSGPMVDVPSRPCAPEDPITILFSSGTTGEPKLIPWTHITPIKCAVDAQFHQDVRPGDIVTWPTNLGWMMGPWLVFASLLNRATIGIYDGAPTRREFGQFIQNTRTTMLGVVPSLVKSWRDSACMEGLDWSAIRVFSSTGECSNSEDMRWLMRSAGGKPVIEYCGGTEIGGAYITGTIAMPCYPGTFNTPALGLDFVILDEQGRPAACGELCLIPPSIGLSTTLLNQDHSQIYFEGMPRGPAGHALRRHGDLMEALPCGGWRALGRADDTMNLGGIKVSSAEIEQILQRVPGIKEVAAVAVSAVDGPSRLVIYAVYLPGQTRDKGNLQNSMQDALRLEFNPLFKIWELILLDSLPRTASNKVMRRALRDTWQQLHKSPKTA
jgi:acetyl-CoA synthetase